MGVDVADWLRRHKGSASIAVLLAPQGTPGKFDTICLGTADAPQTLIAALALLADLGDRVRKHLHVKGSPQMLARLERCREILTAELES